MQESVNERRNTVCTYSERSHNQFHTLFIQGEYAIEDGYFVVSKRLLSLTMELKEGFEFRFLYVLRFSTLLLGNLYLVCMLIVSAKYPVEELRNRPGNWC
jgi:hypothetical protein